MMAVYAIRNIIDGKMYIGSSVNIDRRKREHFNALKRGQHHSIHLQRAWDRYGKNSFKFEILDSNVTKSNLRAKEKEWILKYHTLNRDHGYNISESTTGCSLSGKNHPLYGVKFADIGRVSYWKGKHIPEEICKKMRKPRSEAGKRHMRENQPDRSGKNNSMYGKHFSDTQKEKIRKSLIGKMAGDKNPMHGRERSGANAGHRRRVVQLSKEGEYINKFETITDAAIATGAVRQHISKCCAGKRNLSGGYKWKYED